jgi:transposase-like protein
LNVDFICKVESILFFEIRELLFNFERLSFSIFSLFAIKITMKKNCCNNQCQFYQRNDTVIRTGSYYRKADARVIQRFRCNHCGSNFSAATGTLDYRHRKRREVRMIRHLLCSGNTMRRIAKILKIHPITVRRKVDLLEQQSLLSFARLKFKLQRKPVMRMQFDDLITIEHTKLKPLSVSIAVDKDTRKFLGAEVARIPAFGHLAERSVKKYGRRKSEHKKGLKHLFMGIQTMVATSATIESDKHKFYLEFVRNFFPGATYHQYKGGRGCVAGQGELKKKHFDPLFTLNHNFAMLRANINRLIRKTWSTTKDPIMLHKHLLIYMDYHNTFLIK